MAVAWKKILLSWFQLDNNGSTTPTGLNTLYGGCLSTLSLKIYFCTILHVLDDPKDPELFLKGLFR